jgi:flagellar protein FlaJ
MARGKALERIKQIVELGEGEGASAEDIEKIVERLNKRKGVAGMRTDRGTPAGANLENSRLNFSRALPDLLRRDELRDIGKFYAAFEKPLSQVASAFISLPATTGLSRDLDAASIDLSLEAYLIVVVSFAALFSFMMGVLTVVMGVLFDFPLLTLSFPFVGLGTFILSIGFGLVYPSFQASERASKVTRELPFALRQLSTQIKAGVSFSKAIYSLANSDYGALSEEMERVIKDMESGVSTESALIKLIARTRSKGFKRALIQLVRTLRTGGKLSEVVSTIADDVSFETRMAVRDFTENLNLIAVVYIVVAVVAPVTLTLLSAILQLPFLGGAGFPPLLILLGFFVLLMLIVGIIFMTARMEPQT